MSEGWPDQDVVKLKQWVAEGVRICNIVDSFGGRYKRGAIVGKIRRLKLVKTAKAGGPRMPRGRVVKLSDNPEKGVSIYFNEGCGRILCDADDNFLKNKEGHILCCGQERKATGPYCAHCDSLINNPGYGSNPSAEKKTPINWKHWVARRGNSPRA